MASSFRLANLDIGRMVACSAVILHHANRDILRDRIPLFLHGELGVQFFMILSGYLLARAYAPSAASPGRPFALGDYLWKRVIRIVPAYYAAVAGVSLLIWAGIGSQKFPISPEKLPWHIGTHL
ncbi:MAG: acyltransferase, partial [Oligoflexia bacterium]|nr:acyltransferase [Oligoflexia bacterium]